MNFEGRTITWTRGYVGRLVRAALDPDHLIYPSRNIVYTAQNEAFIFQGSDLLYSDCGGPNICLTGDTYSIVNGGNVIQYISKSLWLIGGTGSVITVDPSDPTSLIPIGTMSSILQIVTLAAGVYATAVQAGLSAPDAATIAGRTSLGSGFTGKNTGTYSLVYTKVRQITGAESNPSEPTNVITVSQQSIRFEFPAAPSDGTTLYRLYATPAGLATTGPYLLLLEITETEVNSSTTDAIARAIEIEWLDGQLQDVLPPVDNNPPEAGSFVFQLGDIMCVDGTFDGMGLSVSVAGQPEAFPARFVSFKTEPTVYVTGRPQDGYVYLLCKNSVHSALYTGAVDGPPVIVRPVWDNVGCAGYGCATVVGASLYMVTPNGRFVRTGPNGEIDYHFASDVESDFTSIANFNPANVVVAYDDDRHVVTFSYGVKVLAYHIDIDEWDTVIDHAQITGGQQPTGTMTGAITLNGKMLFVTLVSSGPSVYNIYKFEFGDEGQSAALLVPGWEAYGGFNEVTATHALLAYTGDEDMTVTGNLYKNLNPNDPVDSSFQFACPAGLNMTGWVPLNNRAGKLSTFGLAVTGHLQKLHFLRVEGRQGQARSKIAS